MTFHSVHQSSNFWPNLIVSGLFLHVGYSVADRYLIEGNSDVKFDPVKTATKLGTILNGDAVEQVLSTSGLSTVPPVLSDLCMQRTPARASTI